MAFCNFKSVAMSRDYGIIYDKCCSFPNYDLKTEESEKYNNIIEKYKKKYGFIDSIKCIGCQIRKTKSKAKVLHVRLGYKCNAKCATCLGYFDAPQELVSDFEYFESIENEIKEKEYDIVEILGGETFLESYSDIVLKIVELANAKSIPISVITNGSIYNEKVLSKLCKSKHLTISFSIDGVGNDFNKIRFPLKYDSCMKTILKIKNYLSNNIDDGKYDLIIAYTLSSLNSKTVVDDIIKISADTNIDKVCLNTLLFPVEYSIFGLDDNKLLMDTMKLFYEIKKVTEKKSITVYMINENISSIVEHMSIMGW